MATAIAYAMQILAALPGLLASGREVLDFIKEANANLKAMVDQGRDPTPEEWDALNAKIDALREDLHSDM